MILIIGDNLEVNTLGTVHRLSGIARGVNHGHSLLPEKLKYPASSCVSKLPIPHVIPILLFFPYEDFQFYLFPCTFIWGILLLILIKKVIQDKFVYLFAVHCSLHTQNLINRKINGRYIHVSLVYHCI